MFLLSFFFLYFFFLLSILSTKQIKGPISLKDSTAIHYKGNTHHCTVSELVRVTMSLDACHWLATLAFFLICDSSGPQERSWSLCLYFMGLAWALLKAPDYWAMKRACSASHPGSWLQSAVGLGMDGLSSSGPYTRLKVRSLLCTLQISPLPPALRQPYIAFE